MNRHPVLTVVLLAAATLLSTYGIAAETSPYASWSNGPSSDPGYFPIGVWLQSPNNAEKYKAAGINLYIGLWQGPTEEQLSVLREAGMRTVCNQNAVGLKYIDDPIIAAWMHDDEPDNAQPDGDGGYGPPIEPSVIQNDYYAMKEKDPSRPVYLNLGQGVAYDNYIGRGVRRNHPEDYPEYIKGTDIVSFDIYPVNSTYDEVSGNLWYVPYGVDRLVNWSSENQAVWNFIETTNIHNTTGPTPAQIRSEIWMSIIHGSRGILYFVHVFEPAFNEDGLLDDPEMLETVTTVNNRIHELAPVINSPNVTEGITAVSNDTNIPVAVMVKRYGGSTYLFAAAMRDGATDGTFTFNWLSGNNTAEVIGEDRTVTVLDGSFTDGFDPYDVHLYRIDETSTSTGEEYPDAFRLLGCRPNPFNPSTVITWTMPRESRTTVTVYDITGRSIAELYNRYADIGMNSVIWDGCDSSGRPAASGIHVYSITAGSSTAFGKMTLLR